MTDRRIVLVTGASQGIGRAAAVQLASADTHIIATSRSKLALTSVGDEIAAAGGEVTLVPLDLADEEGVKNLGIGVMQKFGRLDALLANAGMLGVLGPLATIGPRSFAETIDINLTANWRLIQALTIPMQEGRDPRAVFVTSSVARSPRAFWGPYQASKAGMEALALGWADEIEAIGIKVNLFDPGGTRTKMRANAMPGEDPETLPTPEAVARHLVPLLSADETRTKELIRAKELMA